MPRFAAPMPFSHLYDFTCHKPFTYDGHDYKAGEDFPRKAKGVKRPADTVLEKLYRQRRISPVPPVIQQETEAEPETPAAEDAAPEGAAPAGDNTDESAEGAGSTEDAASTANTEPADGAADVQPETPPSEDDQPAGPAGGDDVSADGGSAGPVVQDEVAADAAPAAPEGQDDAAPAADAAQATDAAAFNADPANLGKAKQPEGALRREHRGFGKHDVVAENGAIVAEGLTKAEADARVAQGL